MNTALRRWRLPILLLALACLAPGLSTAATWNPSSGISGPVADVVIQSGTNNVVAAVQGGNPGIYRSTDHGVSFTKTATFTMPYRLHNLGGFVFAATSQGLFKSSNLTSWTAVGGGLPAGKSVTYVGRSNPFGTTMYATVSAGTAKGLYRSLNSGVAWTRVIVNASTRATTQGWQCGTAENNTVFAGGMLALGGPSCTLLKSTDNGSSWSCTSFPHIVNDLQIDCYNGANFKHVYATDGENNAVYRSTDLGGSFVVDGTGINDCCASGISLIGLETGGLTNGLFTRSYGPIGTTWSQFDTTGLTDLRITRWLRFEGTPSDYVVATPSGAFYYGEEPPCEWPCPG